MFYWADSKINAVYFSVQSRRHQSVERMMSFLRPYDSNLDRQLYVCNPAIKRWVETPRAGHQYYTKALAFDP
ncbi:uncharacterized protein A4U43_C01F4430 [Asparagus officinalis]|uniref:Uncharacterized protein n=1 Tax=Asparagus officinalis TaxID=4686 RepID=A0A5P1FLY7_ASPOF|nr:uncharacterized protein A4U43_C01F4430 [Asparagus officinalis]